ncbi:MAG: hypothetical protein J5806_03640 [Lentisphaeria bacterium]|nr:hypothetical protein [Lentisphaeria bacterium]
MKLQTGLRRWAILLPMISALLVLLAACQTDHTEEALQTARKFALEQTRMLPETSRNYIRYATPVLQVESLFAHRPMRLTEYAHIRRNIDFNPRYHENLDYIISQFVWDLPNEGFSVIAIGRSCQDLSYWEPLKVLLKKSVMRRWNYEKARSNAITYVTDNMLYLSNLERVRVRTSEVEIRETSFDLEYMFDSQADGTPDEWKKFLNDLKEQRDRRQYSVIWPADDEKKRIVVTGFGTNEGLRGWEPSCGMVISADVLNEYTLEIYRDETDVDQDDSEIKNPDAAKKTEKEK